MPRITCHAHRASTHNPRTILNMQVIRFAPFNCKKQPKRSRYPLPSSKGIGGTSKSQEIINLNISYERESKS